MRVASRLFKLALALLLIAFALVIGVLVNAVPDDCIFTPHAEFCAMYR